MNSKLFKSAENLEDNLDRLGRVACIKLGNVIDAAACLLGETKITLPLNNGTNDEPIIVPSNSYIQQIDQIVKNPGNYPLEFSKAGIFV